MKLAAKAYIYSIIGAGAVVFLAAQARLSVSDPFSFAIFVAVAMLASVVKLRLPGMEVTFSRNFLFLLFGVAHFTLAETLLVGCAGGVVQSLCNTRKRPTLLQALFNGANLVLSGAACFLLARVWLQPVLLHSRPAAMALVACAYFLTNTILVTGVLMLLQGTTFRETCRQWYIWSFPYYLVGAALVGLIPAPGEQLHPEEWLILLPLLYLVHFFLGLKEWRVPDVPARDADAGLPPGPARLYVAGVVFAGLVLLTTAALHWQCADPARFAAYFALSLVASTLKVRLPRVMGTVAASFVILLVAIAELSLAEVVALAVLMAVVQSLWRPAHRPLAMQVLFNAASLALSAAFTYAVCRWALVWLASSLLGSLALATIILYVTNTLMVAAVICLIHSESLDHIWKRCYFWSFPYYLVGAAAAGLTIGVFRQSNWPVSLLVLPMMVLVYISYRVHVVQAAAGPGQPDHTAG